MTLTAKRADLDRFLRRIKPFADEALITHSDGKLQCNMMNPAHVAGIRAECPVEGEPDDLLENCWDLNQARDALAKVFKKVDEINIGWNGSRILFSSGGRIRKVPNIDTAHKEFTRPNLDKSLPFLTTSIHFDSPEILTDFAKSIESVSDFLTIHVENGKAAFSSDGDTSGVAFSLDDATVEGPDATALYSHDYFAAIVNQLDGPTTIRFATDYPLRFECADTMMILAPRIESK